MLNQGYILVARLLASPDDDNAQEEYKRLKASFKTIENGEDFIQQLETALKVFSS